MARLYDRMLSGGYVGERVMATMFRELGNMQALEGATVVACDNVARYWDSIGDNGFIGPDMEKHFPNPTSAVTPAFYESGGTGHLKRDVLSYGALVLVHDMATDAGMDALSGPVFNPDRYGIQIDKDRRIPELTEESLGEARFVSEWWLFYEPRPGGLLAGSATKNLPRMLGCYTLPTTAKGAPLMGPPHPLRRSLLMLPPGAPQSLAVAALTCGQAMLLRFYLACCFMHCKNVESSLVGPRPIENQPWRKKHGRPLVRYHVLDIDPMRKVLRDEGGSEETGLKKALHICRGHFAHYPDGLFGRGTPETVWKTQHVRGSAKHGAVVKDYNVKAPKSR